MAHLILISTNGTVWDLSLNEKVSLSKKKLLKLPDSCLYHGYSDDKGILYFINGNLQKKITKYHQSFDRNGHKTGGKLFVKGEKLFTEKADGNYYNFYDDLNVFSGHGSQGYL